MPANLLALGAIPAIENLGPWLVGQLVRHGVPVAQQLLQDPIGAVSRFGDVVVWRGESGQRVLASLESLSESSDRIEQAVKGLEASHASLAMGLGSFTTLSMAAFGVTSLMSAWMLARLSALESRLSRIEGRFDDLQSLIEARCKGNLKNGLDFLQLYERRRNDQDLHAALKECNFSAHVYRDIVEGELAGKKRLPVLNQSGRYYFLSLTAEARCLILSDQAAFAEQRLQQQSSVLTSLAKTSFDQVLGSAPELYFDPNLRADHVTLELLTEVLRQASLLGAWKGAPVRTPCDVFEHFRGRIYGNKGWFRAFGKAKTDLLARLKYLIACLEEISRVESLRIRIEAGLRGEFSFHDLERSLSQAHKEHPAESAGAVAAFAFA